LTNISKTIYNIKEMWIVEFYERENGEKPAEEFILQLDISLRANAIALINKLKLFGNNMKEPYSKYIEDGILELRVKHSSNIARVFYFFQVGKKIILTNGFVKKTQKTPARELKRAIEYKKDYLRRNN